MDRAVITWVLLISSTDMVTWRNLTIHQFFDAGSCIDGRLTSAWNWANTLEKKRYFPVFLLAGTSIEFLSLIESDKQAIRFRRIRWRVVKTEIKDRYENTRISWNIDILKLRRHYHHVYTCTQTIDFFDLHIITISFFWDCQSRRLGNVTLYRSKSIWCVHDTIQEYSLQSTSSIP